MELLIEMLLLGNVIIAEPQGASYFWRRRWLLKSSVAIPDLFGQIRIRYRTFRTGSEASQIYIFVSFFVLKRFMNA
jgi:hypothetical protein